jgi:hypothetical protein
MKQLLTFVILFFVFNSCDLRKNKDEDITIIPRFYPHDNMKIQHLIDSALNYGDQKAYNEVASYYLINDMGKFFFYFALTMANKHNNAEACFHVYYIIAYSTPKTPKETLDGMDIKTKNMALYYLLKSHEMGFESAKFQVFQIFGKNVVPPKSQHYLLEFSKE